MRYRRVGRSGLVASVIGLGCNNFGLRIDQDQSAAVVRAALEAGVNFLDTADCYGSSEDVLGAVLAGRRDDVILATKFGYTLNDRLGKEWGSLVSRRHIKRAVESSLQRLKTDWIDLLQVHYPDRQTPIAETLMALDDLVHEGKVRYVGCTNFSAAQIVDAAWQTRVGNLTPLISAQNEYSLLDRSIEQEHVEVCERFGLGLIPYYPLANGLLTGKYTRNSPPPPGSRIEAWPHLASLLTNDRFDVIDSLEAFGRDRGLSLAQVAIGGLAAQSGVATVIAGATTVEQVQQNVKALDWIPSPDDLIALEDIVAPQRPTAN